MCHFQLMSVFFVSFILSSCGVDKIVNSIDNAVSIIDHGIEDISSDTANWQSILQQIANDLPEEISSTIRNDVQNLVSRSIATTGAELRCNTDFHKDRVIAALERLKARLKGKNPPVLAPGFCQVTPDAIDLASAPRVWSKLTIHGYDLDHIDPRGKKLSFYLQDKRGRKYPIPENRVGRTTHYQLTLNLGNMQREIYQKSIAKVISTWNKSSDKLPQVVVMPWQAKKRPETVNIGRTDYMPPHVKGDKDFHTKRNKHMSVELRGDIKINKNTVQCRVYMKGKEERRDWTEVNGWSNWSTAYTAPRGWKIVDVRPRVNSHHKSNITDHNKQTYSRPGGEVVNRFVVWGDRRGKEAGNWTRVEVHWRPLKITLEEEKPSWAL